MKKSLWQKVKSFFRKWMSAKIIPYMVLNGWRIFFYRLCGYNIGKNGVTIGENAVIGACTLVNKDIPDNATAVGDPCRIIKKSGGGKPYKHTSSNIIHCSETVQHLEKEVLAA